MMPPPFLSFRSLALGALLVALATQAVFSHFDLMERWLLFTAANGYMALNELPFIFATMTVYIAVVMHLHVRYKRGLNNQLRDEIKQRRLAEEELQKALAARDGFFAAMSHDLRTPVNSIMGFSDMMRSQIFGDLGNNKYMEYVSDIHRAASLLDVVIAQILDISQAAYDDVLVIRDEPINVVDEINYSHKLISGWNGKHKEIELAVSTDQDVIVFDRTLFRRYMINLLNNAAKHAGADANIGVLINRGADGGIEITIYDDGRGIASSYLHEILKAFNRGDKKRDPFTEGAGLGLWIVRRIADAHDCRLSIASAEFQGFSVTLSVPAYRLPANGSSQYVAIVA
ncbi:HAMP domain-containing sensor histidine kinase [Thalassospiraceae bacterium LMO-SO8]|nr:HAMP domain-containing histidine kinase [Alphaproteobacteria bacterium LMO-S08]WND75323.1 HAMP domain-containing sensor histidine kinase [Thalassospiraceae bacterium LMO-SO8]